MSSFEPSEVAPGLVRGEDGIWRPAKNAESTPVSYPEDGNADCFQLEDRSFWFRHRSRCIETLVRRHPPDGILLDAGGGNGFIASGLCAAGLPTAILEAGATGAANARSRGIETVICATLEQAGFRPGSLPAIGMFDVLEHIEDDRGTLELCRRLLVPGGMLYLTVPACRWLWSRNDEHAGHFRRYSLRRLWSLLESTGFEVAFGSGMFRCLIVPIFLGRTLAGRLRRRNGPPTRTLRDKQRDHVHAPGPAQRWVQRSLDRELRALAGGRPRSAGSSLLFAARSTENS